MQNSWVFYALLTLVLWGLWGIFGKLASRQMTGWSIFLISFLPSAAILLISFLIPKFRPVWAFPAVFFAIAAGLTGAFGTIFFYQALTRGPASKVIVLAALYPALTVILAFLILSERLTISQAVGVGLALIAAFLISR